MAGSHCGNYCVASDGKSSTSQQPSRILMLLQALRVSSKIQLYGFYLCRGHCESFVFAYITVKSKDSLQKTSSESVINQN